MSARILYISQDVAMKDKASLRHQRVGKPYLRYLVVAIGFWTVAVLGIYEIARGK